MFAFAKFWQTDLTRDCLLEVLDKASLANLRLACRAFSSPSARYLFGEMEISFRSSTFTKPARMAALERIGQNVRTLTFRLPHTAETFLPPLVDPATGEEHVFVYTPQYRHSPRTSGASSGSGDKPPKYGSWEMMDLLVKQYPPLFHAATNVQSFVRALDCMPALRHLKIACDEEVPAHRYRRSVVDFALISLRIAIEQAQQLDNLERLSLLPIHPAGILYLRPAIMGIGISPSGRKRWKQIKQLSIQMESFPYEDGHATDQLKVLHSYLQSFPNLRSFVFHWTGPRKGPCPLSLATEPALRDERSPSQNACPRRHAQCTLRPVKFEHLQYMELANTVLDALQVSDFIREHRETLGEFEFEDVSLRSGSWDDAFAPLSKISGRGEWKDKDLSCLIESMEVPIMLVNNPLDRTTSSSSADCSPTSSPKKKKRRKKRRKNHAPDINSSLFASTAALLWEEQEQRHVRLRALREGVSQLARAKVKTDHMKKLLPSMFWRCG
ncbi:hypothetical protein BGW36DRAFT_371203 [Talaromyces proteolyticus]|uniref:F-box domain-containing protein n=1 Tax=Talaromyces proteolyticus TaxID=1131652 RepID=A0AAD4KUS5_9EURO|nr:uncharacterized protein BGW36DRAFT_371203 [Talaromyces proteolyticus]KAH8701623.1 hypothetical protein BGW36DRAFT_371203 [Talaromyces proteolyticus]